MADGLLQDLPRDLPTFLGRFGTDPQCRAYLVRARWPEGFHCSGCGHDQAYSHKRRLIEECTACGKQHSILAGTIFDHVMSNPPHIAAGAATPSIHPERARAHVEQDLDLASWLAACLRMLRPGGLLTLLHRADRLADALAALHGPLGDLVVYPLWPRTGDRPAKRLLIQGRKGSRGPLRLLPGLVLHEADGRFSPAAEAVLRHAKPLRVQERPNGSGHG